MYIVYEITLWLYNLGAKFKIGNCLFGAVKLTKNDDVGKCGYSSCGIGFDTCSSFSLSNGSGFGKNVIILV